MVHHHNFNALLALLEGAKRQKLKIDGWLGLTIFNNRVGDLFFSLTARFNPIKRRFTILSCFFADIATKKCLIDRHLEEEKTLMNCIWFQSVGPSPLLLIKRIT